MANILTKALGICCCVAIVGLSSGCGSMKSVRKDASGGWATLKKNVQENFSTEGYLKNVRDDFMDVGTVAVGAVPPTVPGDESRRAVGMIPPAFGLYGQITEFMQLGYLYKQTGDLVWDRRGAGVIIDKRKQLGFGPWRWKCIDEKPVVANAYKRKDSRMKGWHEAMKNMRDPVFNSPAKNMIFDASNGWQAVGKIGWKEWTFTRGWQDWEMIALEIAIPDPIITHSGFYVRMGFDPSQLFDAVLSLVCLDLYGDRGYNLDDGTLRYDPKSSESEF